MKTFLEYLQSGHVISTTKKLDLKWVIPFLIKDFKEWDKVGISDSPNFSVKNELKTRTFYDLLNQFDAWDYICDNICRDYDYTCDNCDELIDFCKQHEKEIDKEIKKAIC